MRPSTQKALGIMPDRNRSLEERQAIELMLSGKRETENLLARAESLCFPDHPPFLNMSGDDKGRVAVISSNYIKAIQTKLNAEKDTEGMKRFFDQEFFSYPQEKGTLSTSSSVAPSDCPAMKLLLRASLVADPCETLKFPNEIQIKNDLGANEFKIVIHNHIGNSVSEISYDEYCDSNEHDDFLLDSEVFEDLKVTNRAEWEEKVGILEYGRLKSRFYQAIAGLDLVLGKDDIEKSALCALSISAAYTSKYIKGKMSDAVKTILGTHYEGEFILRLRKEKTHVIQCHLGRSSWTEGYHGIGMMVECNQLVDIFWEKPHQEHVVKDEMDGPLYQEMTSDNKVATFNCTILDGHPLILGDCNTGDEVNGSQHFISFELEKKNNQNTEASNNDGEQKDKIEVQDEGKITLKDCIDRIHSTKASNGNSTEIYHCDTDLFLWGNVIQSGEESGDDVEIRTKNIEPEKVVIQSLYPLETVTSISCSSCHTLAITNLGSVFSCGDGSDGQLGHNSVDSCRELRRIDWFWKGGKEADRIIITQISAGANDTTSHSAAIDSNSILYTWGRSVICGHSDQRRISKSKLYTVTPHRVESLKEYNVIQVSCGGGFTLIRASHRHGREKSKNTHQVYAWGLVDRGRLGIGRIYRTGDKYKQMTTESKKTPWCQSIPTVLKTLDDEEVINISAGESHALALNAKGEIFAWGSNSKGECSVAAISSKLFLKSECLRSENRYDGFEETSLPSLWDDVLSPRRIQYFGPKTGVIARSISAGGIHSAAVDKQGRVFTWGGGGQGLCLGHGDCVRYEFLLKRKEDALLRDYMLLSGNTTPPKWAKPRVIRCLLGKEDIVSIDLGRSNGAALSKSGYIYSWGDSPNEVQRSCSPQKSAVRFRCVMGRVGKGIACGKERTFCLVSGDQIGLSLGANLLNEALLAHQYFTNINQIEDGEEYKRRSHNIDCVILVGGRRLYAHRVIISQRSAVLRGMIKAEERPQDPSTALVEILVPGIQYETMKHILRFMYTDSLDRRVLATFPSAIDLFQAAKKFLIPKLINLCGDTLTNIYNHDIDNDKSLAEFDLDSSLVRDFGRALEDRQFSDVRIMTDGGSIMAHECIFRGHHAGDFFSSLLDVVSLGQRNTPLDGIKTINVPVPYDQILRVILFIYTGMVTSKSHMEWQDDLINSHEFNLSNMKAQCENAITVTIENAINTLALSVRVQSKQLERQAIQIIAMNLADFYNDKTYKHKLQEQLSKCPHDIKAALFEKIKELNGTQQIIPKCRRDEARLLLQRVQKRKVRQQQLMTKNLMGQKHGQKVSISLIMQVIAVILIYTAIITNLSLGVLVPFINIGALLMVMRYIYFTIQ